MKKLVITIALLALIGCATGPKKDVGTKPETELQQLIKKHGRRVRQEPMKPYGKIYTWILNVDQNGATYLLALVIIKTGDVACKLRKWIPASERQKQPETMTIRGLMWELLTKCGK